MRRMRRLRVPGIREMVRETDLGIQNLVQPIFVDERISEPKLIESMPGQYHQSIESVALEAGELEDLGVPAVLLFGLPSFKDEMGSAAADPEGVIQKAVRAIKEVTNLVVITDLCLCEYTSHGHCGLVRGERVLNDETLPLLGEVAVSQAQAGADIVAPSGMMDHMVADHSHLFGLGWIRRYPHSLLFRQVCLHLLWSLPGGGPVRIRIRRPPGIPDGPGQLCRSPVGGAAGHRGGGGYGDGQAGHALPGCAPGGQRDVRHAHCGLSGIRRVLHDPGGGPERMAGRESRLPGVVDVHKESGGGYDHHLLGEGVCQAMRRMILQIIDTNRIFVLI